MKIVVCIKQVPGTSQVQIDPVTGVLIRDGRNAKMNPYDLYGLETALRLKEEAAKAAAEKAEAKAAEEAELAAKQAEVEARHNETKE